MKKRLFDIVVVTLAALAWVPVVLLTALAVLVLSGRPVFYRSRRWVGPRSIITMAKFRVMVPDADRIKVTATGRFLNHPPDSPLYTGVGRVLERLGLTELPQLVHVLKGEMSIVGARPLTEAVRASLVEQHPDLDRRWGATTAGLTGLPQLVGRDSLSDMERLNLEEAYEQMAAQRYRMITDLTILTLTVLIVLGVRKPLTYADALRLAHRRSGRARLSGVTTETELAVEPPAA